MDESAGKESGIWKSCKVEEKLQVLPVGLRQRWVNTIYLIESKLNKSHSTLLSCGMGEFMPFMRV